MIVIRYNRESLTISKDYDRTQDGAELEINIEIRNADLIAHTLQHMLEDEGVDVIMELKKKG